jgi:leishmanolysin
VLTPEIVLFLRNTLLPYAEQALESRLRVLPLATLSVPADTCGTTSGKVETDIPSEYVSGVPNLDLVVLVTARPVTTDAASSVLAFASACKYDSYTKRPILGFINFNPELLKPNDYQSLNASRGTIVHELTHVLGFSSSQYSRFVDMDNNYTDFTGPITVMQAPADGSPNITKLVTPTLVAAARQHFACPTLDGVELENAGGDGTALSHWKRRILNTEYMIGVSPKFPVISALTLAFLRDTGWYVTNASTAEVMQYGLNAGCSFTVVGGCDSWSSEGYRCRDNDNGCTADRLAKATCPMYNSPTPLPAYYQYGSDKKSGTDKYSDYCPRFSAYTQTNGVESYCTFIEAKSKRRFQSCAFYF